MKSPSVEDLVGSYIGDYISNAIDKLEKATMLAKDKGWLRLEITFYRHSTRGKSTKNFFHTHMNYLKELLPTEIK